MPDEYAANDLARQKNGACQDGNARGGRGVQAREPARVGLAGALQWHGAMLVFRSFAIGLLGACLLLVAARPPVQVMVEREGPRVFLPPPPSAPAPPPARPGATIVDVAPGVAAAELPRLVQLAPGEHVTAVDDAPVAGDLDAGALLARLDLGTRRYVDLTVTRPCGSRRVLVLLH